jgi:ectoine hydroxylase-related dioxygenase (phytanoyl-CoA dioxygenase family)
VIELEAAGYAVADIVLADHQCDYAAASFPDVPVARGSVRNLLDHPTVARFLLHERLGEYLWSVIGRDLVAVTATLFNRTPQANRRMQWHQDRAIAVKERLDVRGYASWSQRAGCLQVEPPAEVLSQMIAIRVHLDECKTGNGSMLVIPGSHKAGKLNAGQLADFAADEDAVELCAPRGAILLIRPLLVHASPPLTTLGGNRRVLHIEFAPPEAISPLQWQSAVHLRRAA